MMTVTSYTYSENECAEKNVEYTDAKDAVYHELLANNGRGGK